MALLKQGLSLLAGCKAVTPAGSLVTVEAPWSAISRLFWGTRRIRGISTTNSPTFGLLFDIDGVLVRGCNPIPAAVDAFRKLTNRHGKLQVPVVFVTNAGNCPRKTKAEQLSDILGIEVSPEQVVLSHSPLCMFHHLHRKRVLVSGQGPVLEIAKNLGFQNIVTIDEVREAFPMLDVVDHTRRPKEMPPLTVDFPPIEAVILIGEPIRWETNLQLIIDVLLANGNPMAWLSPTPYPHIPIIACNMDLMWMAEAKMPRFGHGTFLVCLENIYKKLTGQELRYEALIGKPTVVTYNYAEHQIMQQAKRQGWTAPIRTLYAIGDNPMADTYGANLYNQYLQAVHNDSFRTKSQDCSRSTETMNGVPGSFGSMVHVTGIRPQSCTSILVCTGVYRDDGDVPSDPNECVTETVFHGHRDFHFDPNLVGASYIVKDASEAVDLIFQKENWSNI